jgi:ribonuclease T2
MSTTRTAGRFVRFKRPALFGPAVAATLLAAPVHAADFDFYVLSLSWSPSYCAAESDQADAAECSKPRGFVVHGLWPQYERGYPEFCAHSGKAPSRNAIDLLADIMPGASLVRYQWAKHGSCTGLSGEAYLATVRRAYERMTIPEVFAAGGASRSMSATGVEAAFIDANSGLGKNGIAVRCKGSMLREVRICLTRDLEFRPCHEVDLAGCRRSLLKVPSVARE